MKSRKKRTALTVALGLVIFGLTGALFGGWAMAEHPDVNSVVERLGDQKVPVKEGRQVEGQVEITLESTTTADEGTPDDQIYIGRVEREFALAKSRGLDVESLQTTVLGSDGKVLAVAQIPLETIDPKWMEPSELDDATTEKRVREQLAREVTLRGVSLQSLTVGSEDDGTRLLALEFSSVDEEAANSSWAEFMIRLRKIVKDNNAEAKAQIGLVSVDLADEDGRPLFRYLYDVQRGSHNWWQSPSMTSDWFESP